MDESSLWRGFCQGVILTVAAISIANHSEESSCQTENNVSDCTWVLVPTIEKE
jgi:hypothetical protein